MTWIKVEKPVFDLVGVVLSSLGIAGFLAGLALLLGSLWGVTLILRGRRRSETPGLTSLHLEPLRK